LKLFEFSIEYRSGKTHGNADALSRSALDEPESEENTAEAPIIINAIRLGNAEELAEQQTDPEINWMMDLKKDAQKLGVERIIITEFKNVEQRSLYAQWNRLVLNGETLVREYYDDHGNLFWQYLVPKEERLKVLAQLHCSSHSGHLGLDKTFQRLMTRCY
jgi:hypothetical protein